MTREIYSDPYGSIDYSNNSELPDLPLPLALAATQFPTQISVWVTPRISAVQLTYPANGGPFGVTQTPRMGDPSSGKANTINISPNNPITKVRVITGVYQGRSFHNYLPSGLQFQFNDGTTTALFASTGGNIGDLVGSGMFGYDDRALSSILIHGSNTELGGADCVFFGFSPWQSPLSTLMAIREIYVKSPTELSADKLNKAFPKRAIPAALITDDVKAARKAYWERLKALVK